MPNQSSWRRPNSLGSSSSLRDNPNYSILFHAFSQLVVYRLTSQLSASQTGHRSPSGGSCFYLTQMIGLLANLVKPSPS